MIFKKTQNPFYCENPIEKLRCTTLLIPQNYLLPSPENESASGNCCVAEATLTS